MMYNSTQESIKLVHLDIMITPKCTLKCKYCSNLMQHYPIELQQHINKDDLIDGIDALMNHIDWISEVFIIGGEPFTHPALADVIHAIHRYRHKIGYLCVASNGMCQPDDSAVNALRDTQTPVRITIYRQFTKQQIKRCDALLSAGVEAGLFHRTWTMTTQYTVGIPEIFYKYCHHMIMPCVTLRGKKLYYCEFIANADALGCACEHIDFCGDISRQKLWEYLNPQNPFSACRFCSGGSSDVCIEAGVEQLSEPAIVDWTGGVK